MHQAGQLIRKHWNCNCDWQKVCLLNRNKNSGPSIKTIFQSSWSKCDSRQAIKCAKIDIFLGFKIHLEGNVKWLRVNGKFLGERNIFWGKSYHITLGWKGHLSNSPKILGPNKMKFILLRRKTTKYLKRMGQQWTAWRQPHHKLLAIVGNVNAKTLCPSLSPFCKNQMHCWREFWEQ